MPDRVIAEINARLGRPLRVLHIGNIANNAYNNARIQRQYGIDADVICHDYYHVMATPEWEDGGLTTRPDPNFPNWWETNLKGFQRPDWYVQGPMALCLEYIDARRRGQATRVWNAKVEIENAYLDLLRQQSVLHGRSWRDPRPLLSRYAFWPPRPQEDRKDPGLSGRLKGLAGGVVSGIIRPFMRFILVVERSPQRVMGLAAEMRSLVLWPLLAGAIASPTRIAASGFVIGGYKAMRRLFGRSTRDDAAIMREASALVPGDADVGWKTAAGRFLRIAGRAALAAPLLPFARVAHWMSRRIWPHAEPLPASERLALAKNFIDARAQKDLDQTTREQLTNYLVHGALLFGPVLEHYDIIQGYSTDGIIPLVNGHPAFASYEHGTLRELPFESSLSGVICNIAYRNSPAAFITNTDVLPSVERLGLEPARVHYLPHAFDDRKLMNWRDAHPELAPPDDVVVFFSPTRQHWTDEDRSYTKGNDVMLRAAGRLWQEGRRFRLMMVEWGQDLAHSRKLIAEMGFGEAVQWVSPMGKQDLWRAYCLSHAVLDQFTLPALGGVGFETLALGCRLISCNNPSVMAHFFGAAPPVLPASSVDDVTASMRAVLDDPADRAGIGPAGRDWIDQWHSARRTVLLQARVYQTLLDPVNLPEAGPGTES